MFYKKLLFVFFVCFGLHSIFSCSPAGILAGTASTGAVIASSERTVGDAVDDTTIKLKISDKYFKSKSGLFLDIDTSVRLGKVLLTGIVGTQEIRIEAVKLAWEVDGVKEVVNEIEVGNKLELKEYAQDLWISTQVRTKTLSGLGLDVLTYNFETIQGKVHIIGVSKDRNESKKLIEIIRTIKGVKEIINHILILRDQSLLMINC